MTRLKVLALAALITAGSGVAHADSPLIEYIEGWSGPGPYTWAKGVDLRVACIPSGAASGDSIRRQFWNCYTDDAKKVKGLFMFNVHWADNGGTQLFSDDPFDFRKVKQLTLEAMFMYRVNSVVDVGGGIQWARLDDDQQAATAVSPLYAASTQWRTGPTLRVSFTPLEFLHPKAPRARGLPRLVHVYMESAFFTGSSTAADYGNPLSHYSAKKEFQTRVGLSIDVAPLLIAIHPN